MNINEVYKIVSYLVDKYQGTYLSPDDFNMVINMAQRQYLNYMTEDGSGHKGLQSGRKQGTLITTPVVESLSTFVTEAIISPDITGYIYTQPSDLYTTISVRGETVGTKSLRRVTEDKWFPYIFDPIDPPTTADPIYVELGNTYKTYPLMSGINLRVAYIRNPATMRWGNGSTLVYDSSVYNAISNPNGSTQPEWGDKDMEDIIYRAIGIIGINLKDNDLKMAGQIVKQQGQ
jgi:hypothetical protein